MMLITVTGVAPRLQPRPGSRLRPRHRGTSIRPDNPISAAEQQRTIAAPPTSSEDSASKDAGALHPRLRLHRGFPSRNLPRDRDLIVYLPPQYDAEPTRRFPVLYMQDGQNLFDPRTSFVAGRTWQVRESADAAIEAGVVQPLVIVGIYNTGEHRLSEYTHSRDGRMGGGQAEAYGSLLLRDLLPWAASEYRLLSGAENTGLAGSSLGGLVTLYLGLRQSRTFGRLGVLSPSVWWNRKSILTVVREAPVAQRPRIWLDVGDSEGRRALADVDQLERMLIKRGWRPEIDLHYERIPGGTHDEAAWAHRVQPMLRFLFPTEAGPTQQNVPVAESSGLGNT